MKRKFAAFDIDGTIGRDSLFLQIVQELIDSGHIPPEAGPDLEQKLFAYKSRTHKHAFKDYSSHSVDVLFGHIETLKVSDYRDCGSSRSTPPASRRSAPSRC